MSQHPISLLERRLRLLGFLIQNFGPAVGSPSDVEIDISRIAPYIAGTLNLEPDQSRNRVEHVIIDQILVGYANYLKNFCRHRVPVKMTFHTDRQHETEVIAQAYLLHKLSTDAWLHTRVNEKILVDWHDDIAFHIDLVSHGAYVQFIHDLFVEVENFSLRSERRQYKAEHIS